MIDFEETLKQLEEMFDSEEAAINTSENAINEADGIINDVNKVIENANVSEDTVKKAEEIINDANKVKDEARDREILARDFRAKLAKAKDALEDVKKSMNEVEPVADSKDMNDTNSADKNTDDKVVEATDAADKNTDDKVVEATDAADKNTDDKVVEATDAADKVEENKNDGKNARRIVTTIGAIILISALSIGGYVLIKEARSGKVKDSKSTKSASDTLDNNGRTNNYDAENNELLVVETEKPELIDIFADDEFEPLTTENFEILVSDYANKYNKEYEDIVTTKDIVKFAAITNIDMLSEDNRELANQLFGEQSKEEYLNDAAKLIGATVMYNFTQWNSSLSTKDFIRVSNLVYGEQKDKMLKIEEYTDRIASAVNMNDEELVNKIVDEFLTDMNSGSLSKLDDGVGFAAQVNIAVIADGIARNHLNKQNFDMFQVLKTSEKYVSNIFTEYEECANGKNDVKTLTK